MSQQPSAHAQADEFLKRGEYRAAVDAYQRAAAEGPNGSKLLVDWAKALAGDGKPDLAVEKLEAALDADPTSVEAYLGKALLLKSLGRPTEALELYERASASIEPDANLYVDWGMLLAEQGMHEQARWRLERAIAIDDRCVSAYLGVGKVLLELGLAQEAADRFGHVATVLDQSSGDAFSGWGRACFELYDYAGALEKFQKAIELEAEKPVSIDYWLGAGEALYELRRFSEALGAYETAIASEGKFQASTWQRYRARNNSALVALALRSPEEALAYCDGGFELLTQVGLEQSVGMASLHYVAGAAQMMSKRYSEAIASFRRASAAHDSFAVHSMNAIASTLVIQGKYADGWGELKALDEAYERVAALPDSEMNDEQRLAYGTALLWLDRLKEAEAAFKSALGPRRRNGSAWAKLMALYLERREQDIEKASHWQWEAYEAYRKVVPLLEAQCDERRTAEPLEGLGLLHLMMDDFDKAKPLLEEASKLDSESMVPFAGLGIIQVRKGQYSQAVEQFRLALHRDSDNLTVKCHLADAYFHLGRLDLALDAYNEVLRIAPDNVGARIGTGEILIDQAEEAAEDLLYEDAEVAFTKAIGLAASVRSGAKEDRKGSSGLGVHQWAELHYSRGYVRVKICEAEMGDRIGQLTRAARLRLEGALRDFEVAKGTGVSSHRAERAAERVRERLKRFSSATLADSYAPFAVAGISFLLLVVVQVAFASSGGFSGKQDPVSYTTLTLSLLVLLAAGFYLPQVLKLKLGGIELEKATTRQDAGGGLNVHRQPFQERLHAMFEPTVPRNRTVELGGEYRPSGRRADAKKGVDKPLGESTGALQAQDYRRT